MKNADITDPLFRKAVEAVDAGDVSLLKQLLATHPELVQRPIDNLEKGYFHQPFLLWFIADNPIRIDKLPANIIEVTRLLIEAVQRDSPETYQQQLNYTLGLVATGRKSRESGVQIELMAILIDAGAVLGGVLGVLAHGNTQAAEYLVARGSELSLAAAICLDRMADAERLLLVATPEEKQTALIAAAFYGKINMLDLLLKAGVDVNAFIKNTTGFHSHATALHQAVSSGSLDAVKLLIKAGARIDLKDKMYSGTPLEWAEHLQAEDGIDPVLKKKYQSITAYLQQPGARTGSTVINPVNVRGLAPLLLVFDMPASLHFYRDILGFQLVSASDGSYGVDNYYWVMLGLNDVELMMEPKFTPQSRSDVPDQVDRDIILYFGCPDIDQAYAHLHAKGLDLKPPTMTGYGFKALYVKDPDGHLLVFHWPAENN